MKALMRFVPAAIGIALVTPACLAAKITVEVTGHVSQVNDPGNALGGQVTVGQEVTGRYSYETSVPDDSQWSNEWGSYTQSPSQGALSLTAGTITFELDPASPSWHFAVNVRDAAMNSGASDSYVIQGGGGKPISGGLSGYYMNVEFMDYNGSALPSDAIPGGAPSFSAFPIRRGYVSGWSEALNANFDVTVTLESATMSGGNLTVSPASGSVFVRQQPVVPALILPADTQVVGVEGNFNGYEMPGYFSSCYRTYTWTRVAFVCPDANYNLTQGINRVEWRVRMPDGTIAAKVVEWEIIP